MVFEWDKNKNILNKQKHHISFEVACTVFNDPNRLEIYDYEHSSIDEDRYIAIGKSEYVLYVVYTERNYKTRIISARLATFYERRLYYDSIYP